MKSLCYNCMQQKPENTDKCPNCGYINGAEREEHYYLSEGIKLNGRYIVGTVLGHGGFGITYIGFDVKFDSRVAIKEYLPSDISTRALGETTVTTFSGDKYDAYVYGLGRFIDEAKTLAKYNNHQCIVSISDYFEENNTAYIVMEYLDGISLSEYIKRSGGKIELDSMLEIIRPIIDALREVHANGMIHRDVSPDNIFITKDRRIKLLDFGAARHAMGEKSKSLSVVLKPGYAPSEQYTARGKQGPWTDIYALCATMYKCISGATPVESIDRVLGENILPLEEYGVSVPAKINAIIFKGLELDAPNRYSSAQELHDALYNAQNESAEETIAEDKSNAQYVVRDTEGNPYTPTTQSEIHGLDDFFRGVGLDIKKDFNQFTDIVKSKKSEAEIKAKARQEQNEIRRKEEIERARKEKEEEQKKQKVLDARIYNSAVSLMGNREYEDAIRELKKVIWLYDSRVLIEECKDKIKEQNQKKNQGIYEQADKLFAEGDYKSALGLLRELPDFKLPNQKSVSDKIAEIKQARKDEKEKAKQKAKQEQSAKKQKEREEKRTQRELKKVSKGKVAEEINEKPVQDEENAVENKELENKAKPKRRGLVNVAILVLIVILSLFGYFYLYPMFKYNKAVEMRSNGDFDGAVAAFEELGGFNNSDVQVLETYFQQAISLKDAGDYEGAQDLFNGIIEYRDSEAQILQAKYEQAIELRNAGYFDEAKLMFENLGKYSDSAIQILETDYRIALSNMHKGNYDEAIFMFENLNNYSDSHTQILEIEYIEANTLLETDKIAALRVFENIAYYKDTLDLIDYIVNEQYDLAQRYIEDKYYFSAVDVLRTILEYKDAEDIVREICVGLDNKTISANQGFSAAIKSDGSVVFCGLMDPYTNNDIKKRLREWSDIVAIDGRYILMGLKSDGMICLEGNNENLKYYNQEEVEKWTDIIAIDCNEVAGLKSSGTIVKEKSQHESLSDIIAIDYQANLESDGTVASNLASDIYEWSSIVAIDGGYFHLVGLKTDGTVVASGSNDKGQCDVEEWEDIIAISTGYKSTVGLKSDGTIVLTGESSYYGTIFLGEWTDIVQISAGDSHVLGMQSDGTVVATGVNNIGQCNVYGWVDMKLPKYADIKLNPPY